MFAFLKRRSAHRQAVTALYHRIAAAALRPVLFTAYRLEDSLSGRFESLSLHMSLVLRHMRNWPAPAAAVAADLTDYYFTQLDDVLRELGTSDNKVPKKMKEMAGAFLRGAEVLDRALASDDTATLQEILMLRFGPQIDAAGLAHYIYEFDTAIRDSTLAMLFEEGPSFPVPSPEAGGST